MLIFNKSTASVMTFLVLGASFNVMAVPKGYEADNNNDSATSAAVSAVSIASKPDDMERRL